MNTLNPIYYFIVTVFLVVFTCDVSADYDWDDGGYPDRNWSTTNNWNPDGEPGLADTAYINNGGTCDITTANSELCYAFSLGKSIGDTGSVEMTGGYLLSSNSVYIGNGGIGTFTQSGGTNNVQDAMRVGYGSDSLGIYNLSSGVLETAGLYIGWNGKGVFNQSGGTNARNGYCTLANSAGSTGIYYLGNASSSGVYDGGNLTIGNNTLAEGILHGWGGVTNLGHFYQNGRIIADGYGTDRALYLSYGLFHNSHENTNTVPKGFFAQNHGVVVLPKISVGMGNPVVNWGEESGDADIDLVNSIQVSFTNVTSSGQMNVYLLALDYEGGIESVPAPVPNPPPSAKGMWRINVTNAVFNSAEITFRFDNSSGPPPTSLFQYTGQSWSDVTSKETPIDWTNKLIYSIPIDSASLQSYPYFAVGRLGGTVFVVR